MRRSRCLSPRPARSAHRLGQPLIVQPIDAPVADRGTTGVRKSHAPICKYGRRPPAQFAPVDWPTVGPTTSRDRVLRRGVRRRRPALVATGHWGRHRPTGRQRIFQQSQNWLGLMSVSPLTSATVMRRGIDHVRCFQILSSGMNALLKRNLPPDIQIFISWAE